MNTALSYISKFRVELMGVAMLMVVWFHMPVNLNNEVYNFLHSNGCFGVDIFLFLSGFGLFFSSRKGLYLKEYYIKRAIRIFPVYTLIIAVASFINGEYNPTNILLKITTIGWWTGHGAYDWFIPNLVLLYLVYPILYYIICKRDKGVIYGIFIIIIMYAINVNLQDGAPFMQLYRYPVFILGIIYAKWTTSQSFHKYGKVVLGLIFLLFVFGIYLSIYGYTTFPDIDRDSAKPSVRIINGWYFIPYIFIVTGFCLLVSYILSFRKIDTINRFLRLIGGMSLEVYLLHGQFINLTRYLTDTYGLSKPLTGVVLITFSFVVAYWVHLLNIRMMDTLKSKLLK